MTNQSIREAAAERVAETVRRALSLVGPSEHRVDRPADEPKVEDAAP